MIPSLDPIREALGEPKRKASFFKDSPLDFPQPDWMKGVSAKDDPLIDVFYEQKRLWKHGVVKWGCVLKANRALYEAGDNDCPGEVVFSPTESDDDAWQTLVFQCERLWGLVDLFATPETQREREWAADMVDDMCFHRGFKLPENGLEEGVEYRASSVLFHRGFLPDRQIQHRIAPFLVLPGPPWTMAPVPHAFWPDGFGEQLIGIRDRSENTAAPSEYRDSWTNHLGPVSDTALEKRSIGPDVEILHFAADAGREFHTWITVGMSSMESPLGESTGFRTELVFYAQDDLDQAIPLLRSFSGYPWETGAPIHPWDTIPLEHHAEAVLGSSRFPVLLFVGGLRQPDQSLGGAHAMDGEPIYPLMVVPLTAEEFEFYQSQGPEKFMELVHTSKESILYHPDRPSLV